MGLIGFIVLLIVSGLIIGALGRLVLPGPDPMGIGMTIVVGKKTIVSDQSGNVSMMKGYTVVIAKMPKPSPNSSITTLAVRMYHP